MKAFEGNTQELYFQLAKKDFKSLEDTGLNDFGSSKLQGAQSLNAKKFVDMLLGTNGLSMKQMTIDDLIIFTEKDESLIDRAAKIAGLNASKIKIIADNGECRIITIPLTN